MKWILLGLGTVLLVAGAVELLRRLVFWLRRDRYGEGEMELVVIPAGPDDCESLVRAGAQRVEWMALRPPCRLVCLAEPGSQAEAIARRLQAEYPWLELRPRAAIEKK